MQRPPIKHNPAFLTDEELLSAFVVRHDDLRLVAGIIKENTGDSNQHVLVIGPRGIGKTMLVRRVALEVSRDAALQLHWYPLIFAEESYEVGSAGEFWLEALFHLARQTGDPKWVSTYNDLKREPVDDRLRERALAQLMDFADSQGKRILLIVENFNMILGDQMPEDQAWKLRATLMHEHRVMLLATATTRLDLPENTHKAMFELFKSHVLPPLNDEECQAVWRSIAGQELGPRRIRAISILTGGNPRLLAIISHFGARLSFGELMHEMTALVDDHTDYFKSHLDALPATERKAYVALADLWDPSTAREVATASRLGVSMTSSLLKRLATRGAVMEIPGQGRIKRYQLAERMYNIYYLMRRRGAPSERVKAVVQFMVQFYEEAELVEVTRRLTEEACRLSSEERQYHYHAFEGIMRTAPPGLRSKILWYTSPNFLEAPDRPASLLQSLKEAGIETCPCQLQPHHVREVKRAMSKGMDAESEGRKKEAEAAYREAIGIDATYPEAWTMLGRILADQPDRTEEAEQALRKATADAPYYPCGWDALGRLLSSSNFADAEHAFRKALECYPDCSDAWLGLAALTEKQPGREAETAEALRKAEEARVRQTEKYPGEAYIWHMLGWIRQYKTLRLVEAEAAYRKAIEIDPKYEPAWADLGDLLHGRLARDAEAEAVYRKAIKLNPNCAAALGHLGQLLRDQGRYPEAEPLFRRIIDLDLGHADTAWTDLGILWERLGHHTEAETAYRKAVELNPRSVRALGYLGGLLRDHLNKYEEAEELFKRATGLELDSAGNIWLELGILYERTERYAEAEAAYRKSCEIDPEHSCPRVRLVALVLAGLNQPERALELAQSALAVIPDDALLLDGLAWSFFEFGPANCLHRAEAWTRKATALDTNPSYVHTLACVLARAGKTVEAIEVTRRLLGNPKFVGANIDYMVMLFAELASAGCGTEALAALRDSPSATTLEPVALALQMHLGMDVHVAPEIVEVAKDVLQRFQGRLGERRS